MYAVIETGGKQYRVEVGTRLEVELLDAEAGQSITLDRVLLVADGADANVGTPVLADAAVEAEVLGRGRGEKLIAFKYRPKARRRVKKGHRQELTLLRIADIRFNGRSAADAEARERESREAERQRIAEAAARQAAEDAALAAKLAVATPDKKTTAPTGRARLARRGATAAAAPEPAAPTASADETPTGNAGDAVDAAPAVDADADAAQPENDTDGGAAVEKDE